MKKRKAVAADVLEARLRDPVLTAEPREMLPQPRAFALPAADSDVDVVALGEHPAVAAGDVRKLEEEPAAVLVLLHDSVRDVAFQGNTVGSAAVEADRPGRGAVDSVCAKQPLCSDFVDRSRSRAHRRRAAARSSTRDAVAELCSRVGGLLGEERVEPAPLGHEDERLFGACARSELWKSSPSRTLARPVLDHGLDRERQLPHGAHREPAAARLVAGESRLVREEDGGSRLREPVRRGRPGGARADYQDVEALHDSRGYNG